MSEHDHGFPNNHATHVGCMDGVGTDLVTAEARRVSGKQYVDQITGPGIVGAPLSEETWRRIGISVDGHSSPEDTVRHVFVSSHFPGCAGLQGTREEHIEAVLQTADAIAERYADHVPPVVLHPLLVVRTGPKRRRIERLG